MKIIRKAIGSVILLALLIAFVSIISVPLEKRAQVGLLDKTEETVKELEEFKAKNATLENERFKLTLNGKYGSIVMTDKKTGTSWSSIPEEETKKLPANNKRYVRSPVFVKYSEGKEIVQTYPFKEQGTLAVKKEGESLRLDYKLTKVDISFSVVLRLRDDGLEVTVPFDSVKENSKFRLISIEPFPFFEAGTEKENGAIVLPDGSGSLITFTDQHPKYYQSYSQFIYGGDHAYQSKVLENVAQLRHENVENWRQEQVSLPVFGLYRDNRSFLGIVTQGDHDAKINATPSGVRNIKLYRTSTEFLYRNDDAVFLGGRGEVPLMQSQLIKGDRQIRYVLLDRDKLGYVGMAEAYRNYLLKDVGVKPVETSSVPYQLRLLGGAKQDEVIGTSFVAVTTFEQARTIIDELWDRGVTSLEVTFEGWSQGGVYGDQPQHLPAASKLGGNKELNKLTDYAKEKGIKLYLKTNYVRVPKSGDTLKKSSEAIRGLNKEVLESFNYRRSTRQPRMGMPFYLVRPDNAFDKYVSKEAPKFAEKGVQGVQLGPMGSMLYSDPGSLKPLLREDAMKAWVSSLDLIRNSVGSSAVDYGFAYTLGHVDRIDDAPLDSSQYLFADRTIPFYQIVVHGLVPYTSEPINESDNPQANFLRAIEYGAMPSYYLTYDQPSKLQRSPVDNIISSYYRDWLDSSVEAYTKAANALNRVSKLTIAGHDQIAKDVYRTTYADGTQIIVNYGSETANAEGVSIPAMDFTLVPGKEGRG